MDIQPGLGRSVLAVFARNWWLFLIRGIASVVFGLLALILPDITFAALVILFGVYALVDGVGSLMSAYRHRRDSRHRLTHVAEGLLAIGAGLVAFFVPDVTALAIVLLVGIWAIMTGVAEIVAAIRLRREITNEWLLGLAGALSVLAGIVLVAMPRAGAFAIAIVIGAYALVFGIALIALSLRLRRLKRGLEPAEGTPPRGE